MISGSQYLALPLRPLIFFAPSLRGNLALSLQLLLLPLLLPLLTWFLSLRQVTRLLGATLNGWNTVTPFWPRFGPDYLLEGSSKLVGSKLCGADRVRRAYLAGQWAKAVRDKRVPSPNRTPPIELKNRFYAILSGGLGLDRPTVFNSAASYWAAIGPSLADSPAISHGFPSQTEARTYLAGADIIEFDIKP